MRAPILALVLTSIPAIAAADELSEKLAPAAQGAPAPAPEASASAQVAPTDVARQEDANIDRVFLLPSAETQPAGTVAFNDYELFLAGLTYGVTDDLQISATGLVPITDDMPIFVNATAKYRVLKQGPMRLALQGGIAYAQVEIDDFDGGEDSDSALAFQGGVLASICLNEECSSMASASVHAAKGVGENSGDGVALIYGGGVTAKVAKHAKLLLEVTSAGGINDGFESADGALVAYGVRFFSSVVAGDVGFVKPIGDGGDGDIFLGVPFINFTYRQ